MTTPRKVIIKPFQDEDIEDVSVQNKFEVTRKVPKNLKVSISEPVKAPASTVDDDDTFGITKDKIFDNVVITNLQKIPVRKKSSRHGTAGDILLNTTDRKFYGHNGTTWVALSGGGGGPSGPVNANSLIGNTLAPNVIYSSLQTVGTLAGLSMSNDINLNSNDIVNVGSITASVGYYDYLTVSSTLSVPNLIVTSDLDMDGGNIYNAIIASTLNNVVANGLFYNDGEGVINVNASGSTPTPGSVLMAITASSARWTNTSVQNLRVVKQNPLPGEYSSVVAALASIPALSPSAVNPYTVFIYEGLYIESAAIVIPSYVYVVGISMEAVILQPLNNPFGTDFVVMASNSGLAFVSVISVDTGRGTLANNAIRIVDPHEMTIVHKVSVKYSPKSILCESTVAGTLSNNFVYLEYVDSYHLPTETSEYSVYSTDNNTGNSIVVSLENYFSFDKVKEHIIVDGPDAEVVISSVSIFARDVIGDAVVVRNGGTLTSRGLYVDGAPNGVIVENTGSPVIRMVGSFFQNVTSYELYIDNANATGYYSGYVEYNKVYIDPSPTCQFFIANQDNNVITVAKRGGNFSSVAAALAAIPPGGANKYVIYVGPGEFEEPQLDFTGKPGVTVMGYYAVATTIKNSTPTTHFIIAAPDTSFSQLIMKLDTTNANQTMFYYDGASPLSGLQPLRLMNLIFRGGSPTFPIEYVVDCTAGSLSSNTLLALILQYCFFCVSCSFKNAVRIQAEPGNDTTNCQYTITDTTMNNRDTNVGFNSFLTATNNSTVNSMIGFVNQISYVNTNTPYTGTMIELNGRFDTVIQNCIFIGADNGIVIPNTLGDKDLNLLGTTIHEMTTKCIDIAATNITGAINVIADAGKVSIATGSSIGVLIDDQSGNLTMGGQLYQGDDFSTATNISQAIQKGGPLGVFGNLSDNLLSVSGGNIVVNGGTGYLYATIPAALRYITWSTTSVTIADLSPATGSFWIYIDDSATVQWNVSEPNYIEHIIIGVVRLDAGAVTYIQNVFRGATHMTTELDETLRKTIGPLFVSGCIMTALTSTLQLAVSSGEYTYSTIDYLVTGDAVTPISMIPYSYDQSLATWTKGATVTQVPQLWNDTTSGTIITLGGSEWTKHVLYMVGYNNTLPDYLLQYGQYTFTSAVAAITSAIPTKPSFFDGNIVSVGGIVVGGSDITLPAIQLIDLRPTLQFKGASVASTTDHNSLLNLTVGDPHTQYLTVNGSRAMTGDLDLGNNNIVNVGLINGITLGSHAYRHLPNSTLDPLPVGTPVYITESTNSAGIADAFARSDHTHGHGTLLSTDAGGVPLHALATSSTPGFMSAAAFALVNGATSSASIGTLMLRDASAHVDVLGINYSNTVGNKVLVKAANSTSNYTYILPQNTGVPGEVLVTSGTDPLQTAWSGTIAIPSISASFGNIVYLSSTSITTNSLSVTVANIVNLFSTSITTNSLSATVANIVNLSSTSITTTNLSANAFTATIGTIVNINSTNITTQNLTATIINAGLGSVGAPSYAFIGDPNTGMWSPGGDQIAWSTAGTERMRILANGYVGVGTTNPATKLYVYDIDGSNYYISDNVLHVGDSSTYSRVSKYDVVVATSYRLWTDYGDLYFQYLGFGWQNRLVIRNSGDVGIGVAAPVTKLEVDGVVSANAGSVSNPAYAFRSNLNTGMWSPGTNQIAWSTNGVERMRIDSAGLVSIGNLTATVGNIVNLSSTSITTNSLSATVGNIVNLSSTSITSNSLSATVANIINLVSTSITTSTLSVTGKIISGSYDLADPSNMRPFYETLAFHTGTISAASSSSFAWFKEAGSFGAAWDMYNNVAYQDTASNTIVCYHPINLKAGVYTFRVRHATYGDSDIQALMAVTNDFNYLSGSPSLTLYGSTARFSDTPTGLMNLLQITTTLPTTGDYRVVITNLSSTFGSGAAGRLHMFYPGVEVIRRF